MKKFPNPKKGRILDVRMLRWYSVCLTASTREGISLPLAKAMHDFVITGTWNAGAGYEKGMIDEIVGKPDEPVR